MGYTCPFHLRPAVSGPTTGSGVATTPVGLLCSLATIVMRPLTLAWRLVTFASQPFSTTFPRRTTSILVFGSLRLRTFLPPTSAAFTVSFSLLLVLFFTFPFCRGGGTNTIPILTTASHGDSLSLAILDRSENG